MRVNASPESFMIKDKNYSIVSCSPETLIDKKKNKIITKPIAGTFKKKYSSNKNIALKYFKNNENLTKILSILSILGIINIPIIKYSVEWWSTLHQPASIKFLGSSSIHPSMLFPLFLMLLVLLLYCALIFLMKYKTEIIKIKKQNIKRL